MTSATSSFRAPPWLSAGVLRTGANARWFSACRGSSSRWPGSRSGSRCNAISARRERRACEAGTRGAQMADEMAAPANALARRASDACAELESA
jgi:hypothetical protein